MKKILFLITFLFSSILFANLRYDLAQLQQFQNTGSCLSCDLTNLNLTVNNNVQAPFSMQYCRMDRLEAANKRKSRR